MKNEYQLLPMDNVFYHLQCIACGQWQLVDLDKKAALDYLRNFCKTFPKDEELAQGVFKRAYYELQIELMIKSSDSFENIQTLPPFSELGMKNLLVLLFSWIEKGEEELKEIFEVLFDEWKERKTQQETVKSRGRKFYISPKDEPKTQQEIIKILSGDGESIDTAVKFSTADLEKRASAEHLFIIYNYGREGTDWKRGIHRTVIHPKTYNYFSSWAIEFPDGKRKTIYFDINQAE